MIKKLLKAATDDYSWIIMTFSRREALRIIGASPLAASVGTATGAAAGKPVKGKIKQLGHSRLSDPAGGYAEEDIRNDGQYGVLGSFLGTGGSFLVDLSNPTDPTEVHQLDSSPNVRNADVSFDPRDGLYYRSQEPNNDEAEFGGVEIVDYGYGAASPEDPEVIATLDTGPTHNMLRHPEEPILYATNEGAGTEEDGAAEGFDIWDVEDPAEPEFLGTGGPEGGLHDFTVDTDRDVIHAAYIFANEDEFEGYAVIDISDPTDLETIGQFDYSDAPDYAGEDGVETAEDVGNEGFELCHYAAADPNRDLVVVGDEKGSGVPGGKHVFDIGYGDGSLEDPQPIGFTTSPDAELQDDGVSELFDWTTHNHQVVPKGDTTLLVSGDYHEGIVVYDISDPRNPTPADEYETVDDSDENNIIFPLGEPPMAWGANYSAERDLVLVSDFVTGAWTFKVTPAVADGNGRGSAN